MNTEQIFKTFFACICFIAILSLYASGISYNARKVAQETAVKSCDVDDTEMKSKTAKLEERLRRLEGLPPPEDK